MTDNDALFKLLVERTRILCIVCNQAAEVLSEEFEDMVSGPLRNVQMVLDMIPLEGPWDGTFRDSDITIEYFQHATHRDGEARAVRMTHVPSNLSVEAYQRETRTGNELLARQALHQRVRKRWAAQSGLPGPN